MLKNLALRILKALIGAVTLAIILLVFGGLLLAVHSLVTYFHLSFLGIILSGFCLWGAYHFGDAIFTTAKEIHRRRVTLKKFCEEILSNDK